MSPAGGRLGGGTGAGLQSLCAKTGVSDVVLWAAGATVRFYAGERKLSNPHRLCRVTLNRCLLHQRRQLALLVLRSHRAPMSG